MHVRASRVLSLLVVLAAPSGLATEPAAEELGDRSHVILLHRDDAGSGLVLESASYELEGRRPIVLEGDALRSGQDVPVLDGVLIAGRAKLRVRWVYRPNGLGVFSYTDGIRYRLTSSAELELPAGKSLVLRTVGFEAGAATEPPNKRLRLRFDRVSP